MAEVRSLLDDWRLRRERLLASQFHDGLTSVLLKVFSFLIKRYDGTPEGNQAARYPLRSAVRLNERAIVVNHHLGRGEVAGIKTRAEAHAKSRRIMNRIALIDAQRDLKVPAGGRIDFAHAMPWGNMLRFLKFFLGTIVIGMALGFIAYLWDGLGDVLAALFFISFLVMLIWMFCRTFITETWHRPRIAVMTILCVSLTILLTWSHVRENYPGWFGTFFWCWLIFGTFGMVGTTLLSRRLKKLKALKDTNWLPQDRRTMLSDDAAERRIAAAKFLGENGSLDDVGLLSDLLQLPPQPDEDPQERPELVAAIEAISERHR